MFEAYFTRWDLMPDGDPIVTPSSHLLPVRRGSQPGMLKLALEEEERSGARLMRWWGGVGAAEVLAHDGAAILLERAQCLASLSNMTYSGNDDEACRILCAVAAQLHAPRPQPWPELIPLSRRFRDLESAAANHGGILARCAETARALLGEPRDVSVLHGDLHHENVLDFGARGWLAIDPKGLTGERGFDFANIFTNPDFSDPTRPVGTDPDRFVRRVSLVAELAGLERIRLLRWVLAWAGLSAAWFLGDRASPAISLRVAELAGVELDR